MRDDGLWNLMYHGEGLVIVAIVVKGNAVV